MHTLKPSDKLALTPAEAARVLSCSRSKIYDLISRGKIKVVKLGPGRSGAARITWRELQRLLGE